MGDVNSIMLSKLHCVIVHYRAWTESTLHKFEDTWNEQKPVELVLGKGTCLYDPFFFFLLFNTFQNVHNIYTKLFICCMDYLIVIFHCVNYRFPLSIFFHLRLFQTMSSY